MFLNTRSEATQIWIIEMLTVPVIWERMRKRRRSVGVLSVVAKELCYNLGGKGCTGNPVTSVQIPFSLTLVRDFPL